MKRATTVASVLIFVLINKIQAGPDIEKWADVIQKAEQDCINKTGISETILEKTRVTLELPDDPAYKKYISCFYKKQGYQNEDGDMIFYNIQNMITDVTNRTLVAADVINSCKDSVKQPSHEDYAYTVVKCLFEASRQQIPEEQHI